MMVALDSSSLMCFTGKLIKRNIDKCFPTDNIVKRYKLFTKDSASQIEYGIFLNGNRKRLNITKILKKNNILIFGVGFNRKYFCVKENKGRLNCMLCDLKELVEYYCKELELLKFCANNRKIKNKILRFDDLWFTEKALRNYHGARVVVDYNSEMDIDYFVHRLMVNQNMYKNIRFGICCDTKKVDLKMFEGYKKYIDLVVIDLDKNITEVEELLTLCMVNDYEIVLQFIPHNFKINIKKWNDAISNLHL